jgi:hypothetical protein
VDTAFHAHDDHRGVSAIGDARERTRGRVFDHVANDRGTRSASRRRPLVLEVSTPACDESGGVVLHHGHRQFHSG